MMVSSGQYSSASDVYAFTLMLNELLTEEIPFHSVPANEIMMKVVVQKARPKMYTVPATDSVGCGLMNLIRICWDQNPAQRMTFLALTPELRNLLSASIEIARNGTKDTNSSGAIGSDTPRTLESSVSALANWMTTRCGLRPDDSASLSLALVTTKSINTVELLSEVMQRHPDMLVRELRVCAAYDIKIKNALHAVRHAHRTLSDLSIEQVCMLLDSHNLHSSINTIVVEHEISGASF
jgi:hypothetical protein